MATNNILQRIIIDPNIMVGKPVIKGTRLTVELILGLLGQGETIEKLLQEYPRLSKEDIFACLLFAQQAIGNVTFMPMFK
ncbi:MAG: DUF433 domain-containing protein [Candidatus Babeliales bacterium]|jgi:uncharacterized protein (DUF433 family)